MLLPTRSRRAALAAWTMAFVLSATGGVTAQDDAQDPAIKSWLTGTVTVSAEVDSTGDYSGFEVIVANNLGADLDTLGYAITSTTGEFSMDIEARNRGLYGLLVKRGGQVLSASEMAVTDGDSASVKIRLPLDGRPVLVRSYENAAWLAYKNTDAQHQQTLVGLVSEGKTDDMSMGTAVLRTASLLWGLRNNYMGTIGANAASVKSITLLEGWSDSLVVARVGELDPGSPGLTDAIQSGFRATGRLEGQEAAIAFLDKYLEGEDRLPVRATLQAAIVQSYLDSLNSEMAIQEAKELMAEHPETAWSKWAERAEYEAQNLMPGAKAPGIKSFTRSGDDFDLADLAGQRVVLSFWSPISPASQADLAELQTLAASMQDTVRWVSVVLHSNLSDIEAFYEGREIPGFQLQELEGLSSDLARSYNVQFLPTRFLIDPDGTIVKKYVGNSILRLADDLGSIVN